MSRAEIEIFKKPPRNLSQQTILTLSLRKEIRAFVRRGVPLRLAVKGAGVAMGTFYRWKELAKIGREPFCSFFKRLDKSRTIGVQTRIARIDKAAIAGDWKADKFYLESVHHKDFGKRNKIELDDKQKPNHVDLSNCTDEQLATLEGFVQGELVARHGELESGGTDLVPLKASTSTPKKNGDREVGKPRIIKKKGKRKG